MILANEYGNVGNVGIQERIRANYSIWTALVDNEFLMRYVGMNLVGHSDI